MRCPCCKQEVDEDVFDERLPILFDGNYIIYKEQRVRLTKTELDVFTYVWDRALGIDRKELARLVYRDETRHRTINAMSAKLRVKLTPIGLTVVATMRCQLRLITIEDFKKMELPWRHRYKNV